MVVLVGPGRVWRVASWQMPRQVNLAPKTENCLLGAALLLFFAAHLQLQLVDLLGNNLACQRREKRHPHRRQANLPRVAVLLTQRQ